MAEAGMRVLDRHGPDRPLQVSQLNRYLKDLVEHDEVLASLSVEGEICEFSQAMSGHCYFALKDATSQVACVLFRREAARQVEEVARLRKGIAVVVHGFLTMYEPRGVCQIYVERVVVQGAGLFFQRFEKLKAQLESEGLFADDRKRRLPGYPRVLALVTSPGSQAYHDVLHRLRMQYPYVRVIEVGVSVQGERAADEIVLALDIVNRLTDAELILLVRGGGSPEDLAAFNDERLARAIYASRLPVVTGIGHDQDQSIADFVADWRAATPSLAAAAAVPDIGALVETAAQLHREMASIMQQRVRRERAGWVDVNRALLRSSPQNRLRTQRQRADDLTRSAERAVGVVLRGKRQRLHALRVQLQALDPLAILGRGYAVLSDRETGKVIGSRAAAVVGRELIARVSDGEFTVKVQST